MCDIQTAVIDLCGLLERGTLGFGLYWCGCFPKLSAAGAFRGKESWRGGGTPIICIEGLTKWIHC